MKHSYNKCKTLVRRTFAMRFVAVVVLFGAVLLPASAQAGLAVDDVFATYGHVHGSKMVEMNGASLRGYDLKVYKSLTYRKNADKIEAILKRDRAHAKKIREVVSDGRVVSGYYMMTPVDKTINRYVLFSKTGNGRGTVIYIEGELSPDDIMKLCYSRKK